MNEFERRHVVEENEEEEEAVVLHWYKDHYSKETFVQGTVVQGDSLSKEKRVTLVQGDTSIDFSPRKLYLAHNYVCWVPLSPLVRSSSS